MTCSKARDLSHAFRAAFFRLLIVGTPKGSAGAGRWGGEDRPASLSHSALIQPGTQVLVCTEKPLDSNIHFLVTAHSAVFKASYNLYTEGTDSGASYIVQRHPKVLESSAKEHKAL